MLASLLQAHGEHPTLRALEGRVLAADGQYEQAVACFRASLALAPGNGPVLASAGGCLHFVGRLPDAIEHYRAALSAQCDRPLQLTEVAAPAAFDAVAAERRLWDVLVQLADAGVQAFATSGTLLGLERDGGLLPFDKDLDVGMPFVQTNKAVQFLTKHGWHSAKGAIRLLNPVTLHDGRGLALDLCGFVPEFHTGATLGGFWLQGAPKEWQRITEYSALRLHKKPCPDGREVWALVDPQAWLADLYGPEWRTPDPEFDTVIGAHNLRGFGLLTQCYALGRIYQAWLQGRLQKAASLVRQTLRHVPDDALLQRVQWLIAQQAAQARIEPPIR